MGLEKRIRSRINPFPLALSSLSLSHVLSFMSSLLLVDEKGEEWEEEEEEEDGRGYGEFVRKYNKEVESLFEVCLERRVLFYFPLILTYISPVRRTEDIIIDCLFSFKESNNFSGHVCICSEVRKEKE